jgi:hypothetical protein
MKSDNLRLDCDAPENGASAALVVKKITRS